MPPPPSAVSASSLVDVLLSLLPPVATTIHAVLSPFTKVEESFTLHALHDFVYRGFCVSSHWDHVEFPGPLPRSFLPALCLSVVVKPVVWVVQLAGPQLGRLLPGWQLGQQLPGRDSTAFVLDRFVVQILARIVLGLLSSATLLFVGRQVRLKHGSTAQRLYILLSVTQFHIMYYSSRTLPNFMALPFVNVAFGLVIGPSRAGSRSKGMSRDGFALAMLAAAATIVRSELACLLGPLALALLAKRRLTLSQTVGWGAFGGLGGTALTILVDSYYWARWTWPEAHGVWFNVWRNESSKQWGTSPWHYYLKHLPLLLLTAAPLLLLASIVRAVRRRVDWTVGVMPAVAMIGAMSALGHKEWRFVAYVVPWLNVPAAVMAAHLWQSAARITPVVVRLLLRAIVVGTLTANALASAGLLWISSGNYPGGEIMRTALRSEMESNVGRSIHLYSPSLPLQTGSTLFLASSPSDALAAVFNKTELSEPVTPTLARAQRDWTHVILPSGTDDEVALWTGSAFGDAGEGSDTSSIDPAWVEVARASGFGGFDVQRGSPASAGQPSQGPWFVLSGADGVGVGWGTFGATVKIREGERCVLVRRRD